MEQAEKNRLSHFAAVLFTIIGLLVLSLFSYRLWVAESENIRSSFRYEVARQAASFEREVQLNLEILLTLNIAFSQYEQIDNELFTSLTLDVIERVPAIQAFEWAPFADAAAADELENLYSDDEGFWLYEHDDQGNRIAVSEREWYVPVRFVAPFESNAAVLGFDLASEERRLNAMLSARDKGEMVATQRLRLVQEPADQSGIIVFTPLYRGASDTLQQRRDNHHSFLNATFQVSELFRHSVSRNILGSIRFQVVDQSSGNGELLYSSHDDAENNWLTEWIHSEHLSEIAGRQWVIVAIPAAEYVSQQRGYLPATVMISGVILIILLLGFTAVLLNRNHQLNLARRQLEAISLTDSLTGLANRRHFDQHLENEWARSVRQGSSISLLMIDIDRFKPYNDLYGHLQGDKCLKQVAHALDSVLKRPTDLVARYGGEEFAVILSDCSEPETIAEQCRAAVEALSIPHPSSDISDFVTVSIGVNTVNPHQGLSPKLLAGHADQALYRAKELGGNRVVSFG